jgi:hypothetical protein
MDERSALAATALEAFETAEPRSPSWTDADRAWADRVGSMPLPRRRRSTPSSRPVPGMRCSASRRASRCCAGLASPSLRAGRWTIAAVTVAFVVGLLADHLADSRRINLLAPPMWGVLAWNAVVYLGLLVFPLLRLAQRRGDPRGPIVRGLAGRIARRIRLPRLAAGGSAAALHRFAALWAERGRALATRRAETVLHAAAAALALGLIAGLYLRGLVFDYRVGWQSTFLTPEVAHAVVTTLLTPAALLSGIALPMSRRSRRCAKARAGDRRRRRPPPGSTCWR